MQTRVIDGFEVALLDGEAEPRIQDVELGRRIGLSRPRDIRRVIKQWHDAGHLVDTRCEVRSRGGVQNSRSGSALGEIPSLGRPASIEYFLCEADTLFIVTKCNTPLATQITKQIIQVFISWRRGQLAQPKTDPALTAIHEELKAIRMLNTHIAKAVGIPLPDFIAREAKGRNRSHSSLEKHVGIRLHIENRFELRKTYAEIVESVRETFHLKISKTSLSRFYRRWTVRTGRTSWSPRFPLLS